MVFREEYVKGGWLGKERYPGCLDRHYQLGDRENDWRVVCGFDPAIGVQKQAKFCAHVTLALGSCRDHDKCLWVVDLLRDQMSLQQQVQAIIERAQKHRAQTSWIEANSYQKGLYDAVKHKTDELGLALPIEPHYTTKTNKPDPEVGVQALAPWFERGWVHIPWADPHSRRIMQLLVDELVQYPAGRTTDCVMALWIAWRALDEHKPTFKAMNYLDKVPARNWRAWGRPPKWTLKNPYYERSEA
jgi:predicted phage terminase large subunit-like protein